MADEGFLLDEVLSVPLNSDPGWLCSAFAFRDDIRGQSEVVAVHRGGADEFRSAVVPVRIHSGCVTGEVFGSDRCDCWWQLSHAREHIDRVGFGLIIYFPSHEGMGLGIVRKLRILSLLRSEGDPPGADARAYNVAISVLRRLEVSAIELITNNPAKSEHLSTAGLNVVRLVPTISDSPGLEDYLQMKARVFGHRVHKDRPDETLC